jgi:hypothetical protein
MSTASNESDKYESSLINALTRADELVVLIDRYFFENFTSYFIEMYLLTLRELCWYCNSNNSPITSHKNDFTEEEILLFNDVKDIRDAICHRTSENNKFSDYLWIFGAKNFKEDDVQIQYGKHKAFLVKELFSFHKKVKTIAKNQFPFIKRQFENEFLPDLTECAMNHISVTLADKKYIYYLLSRHR